MSDDEKDEAIFKVDTVPPPAGEDDAYSAPTRVGPMAAAVVEEMMVASVRKAAELTAAATEKMAASEKKAAADAASKKNTPVTGEVAPKAPPADALSESDLVPDVTPAPTRSKAPPVPPRPAAPAAVAPPSPPPPRLYDEADDEDNAATLLSRAARAPVVQATAVSQAPVFPSAPMSAAPMSAPPMSAPPMSAPPVSPRAPSMSPRVPSMSPSAPPRQRASFAPTPSVAPPQPLSLLAFLPLAIGFAIFAIGLAFYFWAR